MFTCVSVFVNTHIIAWHTYGHIWKFISIYASQVGLGPV